jgi:site-specific DNA-methyltransferase (adenine-specific)
MVVNIEDAGFDIRDQIMWIYGSGFPKSMNVAKAIESQITLGKSNTRSLKATEQSGDGESYTIRGRNNGLMGEKRVFDRKTYTPQGDAAKWNGWGTTLKPAHEPIVVARKPIPTTVAKNVLEYGTGGLNIDACRVGDEEISVHNAPKGTFAGGDPDRGSETIYRSHQGRWPANVILSHHVDCLESGESAECHAECPFSGFPDAEGRIGVDKHSGANQIYGEFKVNDQSFSTAGKADDGSAARFFYCAKASKKERNHGLGDLPDVVKAAAFQNRVCSSCNKHELDSSLDRRCVCDTPEWGAGRLTPTKNSHPTVKPIALMKYLCKLVTPPGGVILDPFMGSGTTGIAAVSEGFNFIGIDLDESYVDLSRVRIDTAISELQESIKVPQEDTASE